MSDKILCECGSIYDNKNASRHFKSKKHLNFIQNISNEPVENQSDSDSDNNDNDTTHFLTELENTNFIIENETEKPIKEPVIKQVKKKVVKFIPDDISELSNEIFSKKLTVLMGADRLVLLAKIKQYKILFPDEVKKFRVKKNPSVDDLTNAIAEMDAIIDTNSIDNFITDGFLQSLKVCEGLTQNSRYNVSGLSDILKNNKQFHTLTKQLYLKYKIFSNIPHESQLCFLVFTTAYIMTQKNNPKSHLSQYLNEEA